MEDADLLRAYLDNRSEAAFAELVRRYVDLAYSTALRVVGEPQMALDVSQEVFLKLARQAGAVRKGDALAAWLYRVARAQAINAVRAEARRRHREQEAMRMNELETGAEAVWVSLKPWLEEAMGTLDRADQAAVVLRFFSNKSLAEVGQALDVSEEAARKRVNRALEKLRHFFSRRGVQVSSSVLASILAANAVQSAPVGFAASLTAASLAGAATAGSASLSSTLIHTLLMTKTSAAIVAVVVIGSALTPFLLKQARTPPPAPLVTTPSTEVTAPSAEPAALASPPASPPAPETRAASPASPPARSLLERVAALPPLTRQQIETYVAQNHRSAESLLAAYRVSADKAWLVEAATRFPNDPDVQYAVLATRAFPEAQRQWADAYKASSADNALAWYLSAFEHFKTGARDSAIQDLAEASRKPVFRAELASTLQAVEELNLSGGRASDEAKIAAFQTCAQFPELTQMRDLAKALKETVQQSRQQNVAASAESLAGMGLVLGSHLSAGGGSQTVINQLVGVTIEKMFLQQLDPNGRDPFGRPAAEVSAAIQQHQATLKNLGQAIEALTSSLPDPELANYFERVKLYGEEAALTWLKAKHETP